MTRETTLTRTAASAATDALNLADQDRADIATVRELALKTAVMHEHAGDEDLVTAYARALSELQVLLGRLVFLVDHLSQACEKGGRTHGSTDQATPLPVPRLPLRLAPDTVSSKEALATAAEPLRS
jgi:hypothetical protein